MDLYNYEADGNVSVYTNFHDEAKCLFTDIESVVTYTIDVPEAGFYNVYMEYLITESRGVAAERAFYINGELPFDDALNLNFTRIWTVARSVSTTRATKSVPLRLKLTTGSHLISPTSSDMK